jgi:hypothetical protein
MLEMNNVLERKQQQQQQQQKETFVSPGMGATLHTFFAERVLMTLLFPTLGKPTKPTLI